MSDKNARLDSNPDRQYTVEEAKDAFRRMVQRYNWDWSLDDQQAGGWMFHLLLTIKKESEYCYSYHYVLKNLTRQLKQKWKWTQLFQKWKLTKHKKYMISPIVKY